MREIGFLKLAVKISIVLLAVAISAAAGERLYDISKSTDNVPTEPNVISQRGFVSSVNPITGPGRDPDKPWKLPNQALSTDAVENIHILVLRYNFQYEVVDDPNTTGRGVMNLGEYPLPDTIHNATSADSLAYLDSVGHFIDPPPHDSIYFDAHMQALNRYWSAASEGRVNLTWDIYPPANDSIYTLPYPMSHYGRCDSVIVGLEYYFEDCVRLADSAHIKDPNHPDIDFSQYQAFILFHAGSDRQNDIGFPETCSDLFTGFIKFGNPIAVDHGAVRVGTALMMPETSSQDNRATALNAVLAHEFGHQLGLVDLYSTRTFMSQIGDFALMDNNGFGTGIDFGFPVGRSFGVIPLYPMAWSRAYLGYVPVYDFREGTDIGIVAAEVASNDSIKIARLPISEKQYYLIENRQEDVDKIATNAGADYATNVIQGPGYRLQQGDPITYTHEYDFLMPGSGLAIWLIDEEVAEGDFDGDGLNNFLDNQLQWDKDRRFVTLVEADGLVQFGGNYRSGFGRAEDLFRDDRATSFTPLTNPPAVDNLGNDTRIFITGITRDSYIPTGSTTPVLVDTLIKFDLATDKKGVNFPIRAGMPALGLSPVVEDLDNDGVDDILIPAGRNLVGVTAEGEPYLAHLNSCDTCGLFFDSVTSWVGVNDRSEPIPLFARLPILITTSPVTGELAPLGLGRQVAIGYTTDSNFTTGAVAIYVADDEDADGRADAARVPMITEGFPIALSFGNSLWALTSTGKVYNLAGLSDAPTVQQIDDPVFYGTFRIGSIFGVISADTVSSSTFVNLVTDTIVTWELQGELFEYGPVVADIDRDSNSELILMTAEGGVIVLDIDLTQEPQSVVTLQAGYNLDHPITTNPVISDMDGDNQPDFVVGTDNALLAYDRYFTLTNEYPAQVSEMFPNDRPVAPPVVADINSDGQTDIAFPSLAGSLHVKGPDELTGFPVSALSYPFLGVNTTIGSPVIFSDEAGGMLGFLAADGWFYAYQIDLDNEANFWPMAGREATGSYSFDVNSLGAPSTFASQFDSDAFYAYPNPVLSGAATIRYFLGEEANSVKLTLYDLSGMEVANLNGPTRGGVNNEIVWNCSGVTPGVYRCMIDVAFANGSAQDFTDIAVIK